MHRRLVLRLAGLSLTAAMTAAAAPAGIPHLALSATLSDPVVAAAGDIACSPSDPGFNGGAGTLERCNQRATASVLRSMRPAAVLPLGDTQYDDSTRAEYAGSYAPTWGAFKPITHPTVGNHEYQSPGASGYFTYFGAAAGNPSKGYYSFDLGAWHVISLNANCGEAGGCRAGSPQEKWLAADLAGHPRACTLAFWHQPRFSSVGWGNSPATAAFWADLYAAHADIVLNGHVHNYERFAPMRPTGAADPAHGIREFIVGTGGESLARFGTPQPASQARGLSFGVLELTLHPTSYLWDFVPTTAGGFHDSGSQACH